MFLTNEEIVALTGYRRYSAQLRWLADHGYRFEVNALGRPVVLASSVEHRLQQRTRSTREPRFEALKNG